ncbi:MAG TPA: hypothetical protein VNQ73_17360 [Ilumatobacter sp.]|nr:hypothetical protein [Ilumatobacter sp.]
MTDFLLRDVPDEDMDELKAAAHDAQQSLQAYLRESVVHQHAIYLRRLRAIANTERRLAGRTPIPDDARQAAWDAAADTGEAADA